MVFGLSYVLLACVEAIAAFVLSGLAGSAPDYVSAVLEAAAGGTPGSDIGGLQVLLGGSGATYIVGGLLFGVALFRAGVLSRWAAVLLAVGTTSSLALAVLPESFDRPFAISSGSPWSGWGCRSRAILSRSRRSRPIPSAGEPLRVPARRTSSCPAAALGEGGVDAALPRRPLGRRRPRPTDGRPHRRHDDAGRADRGPGRAARVLARIRDLGATLLSLDVVEER